jgi:hypothetical protein
MSSLQENWRKAEQVLPGSEGGGGKRELWVGGGRNDPNNICTFEYMNKEKNRRDDTPLI